MSQIPPPPEPQGGSSTPWPGQDPRSVDPPTQQWGTRAVRPGAGGQQPPAPPPQRRRLLLWIALAAVVVAVAAAGLVFLLGGDDDDTSGSTTTTAPLSEAEEVVQTYFAALEEGDCETLIEHVTEETWSEGGTVSRDEALEGCEQDQEGAPPVVLEEHELVSGGTANDDTATVEVTVSVQGETTTTPVELVKVEGEWKLSLGPAG